MNDYTQHQFSLFPKQRPVKRVKITEVQKAEARLAMKERNPAKAMRVLGDILNNIERNL